MADILFKCSGCSAHLAVDDAGVGSILNCTTCGQQVVVPKPDIQFRCPKCQSELAAPPRLAGEPFDCPNCETGLTIPLKSPLPLKRPTPSTAAIAPPPQQAGRRCPYCRSIIATAAIVCVSCGVNLHTGRRIGESRQEPPPSDKTGVYVVVTLLIIAVVGGGLFLVINGMNRSEGEKVDHQRAWAAKIEQQQPVSAAKAEQAKKVEERPAYEDAANRMVESAKSDEQYIAVHGIPAVQHEFFKLRLGEVMSSVKDRFPQLSWSDYGNTESTSIP